MTVLDKIKGRKIGIIGMARSGMAAALLASRFEGIPFVTDSGAMSNLTDQIVKLEAAGISYETDGHTDNILSSDYIVISPGVPLSAEIVKKIKKCSIPIFSELEFASWVCQGRVIAVTGSNGKTTTTTLIGDILRAAAIDHFVCGNIGQPFSEIADRVRPDSIAVVEVSTFQLETIDEFQPDVALILNLSPDHLDRHGSYEAYKELKYRIAENQQAEDILITNFDDPELSAAGFVSNATRKTFSIGNKSSASSFVSEGKLWYKTKSSDQAVLAVADIKLIGRHNLQNVAAALLATCEVGVDPALSAEVLKSFNGVEHRLEPVAKIAGVRFVNDSKATNVDSTTVAIEAVSGQIHLILGGIGKGAPYAPLLAAGENKILSLVLIGQARDEIYEQLGKSIPCQFADSLEDAVKICFSAARPGETVLLSPACASFDMYKGFEERGRSFKEAVNALKTGEPSNGTLTNH